MTKSMKIFYFICALAFIMIAAEMHPSYAGEPLFVATNGKPVRWPAREVKGGPLNLQTVDPQGRVIYRVDSGPLGPLSNSDAVKLVDRIFKLYTDIPTSTIEFVNGG